MSDTSKMVKITFTVDPSKYAEELDQLRTDATECRRSLDEQAAFFLLDCLKRRCAFAKRSSTGKNRAKKDMTEGELIPVNGAHEGR